MPSSLSVSIGMPASSSLIRASAVGSTFFTDFSSWKKIVSA